MYTSCQLAFVGVVLDIALEVPQAKTFLSLIVEDPVVGSSPEVAEAWYPFPLLSFHPAIEEVAGTLSDVSEKSVEVSAASSQSCRPEILVGNTISGTDKLASSKDQRPLKSETPTTADGVNTPSDLETTVPPAFSATDRK